MPEEARQGMKYIFLAGIFLFSLLWLLFTVKNLREGRKKNALIFFATFIFGSALLGILAVKTGLLSNRPFKVFEEKAGKTTVEQHQDIKEQFPDEIFVDAFGPKDGKYKLESRKQTEPNTEASFASKVDKQTISKSYPAIEGYYYIAHKFVDIMGNGYIIVNKAKATPPPKKSSPQ